MTQHALRLCAALAVLLALVPAFVASAAPCPALGVDNATAVAPALASLKAQQLSSGGIGFAAGTADEFTTLRVTVALGAAGCQAADMASSTGATPLTYLAARAPTYVRDDQGRTFPGRAGQFAHAVAAVGGTATSFGGLNLLAEIQSTYNPSTGIYSSAASSGFSTGAAGTFSQLWPILGLAANGQPVPTAATDYLLALQESDGLGGWGFGRGSDLDTTGQVLLALSASHNVSSSDARIQQAIGYLRGRQLSSGGWGFGGSTSADTTAVVIQGLASVGIPPEVLRQAGRNPYDALRALQAGDGSIGGNALGTADAIPGLTTATFPVVRHRLRFPSVARNQSF